MNIFVVLLVLILIVQNNHVYNQSISYSYKYPGFGYMSVPEFPALNRFGCPLTWPKNGSLCCWNGGSMYMKNVSSIDDQLMSTYFNTGDVFNNYKLSASSPTADHNIRFGPDLGFIDFTHVLDGAGFRNQVGLFVYDEKGEIKNNSLFYIFNDFSGTRKNSFCHLKGDTIRVGPFQPFTKVGIFMRPNLGSDQGTVGDCIGNVSNIENCLSRHNYSNPDYYRCYTISGCKMMDPNFHILVIGKSAFHLSNRTLNTGNRFQMGALQNEPQNTIYYGMEDMTVGPDGPMNLQDVRLIARPSYPQPHILKACLNCNHTIQNCNFKTGKCDCFDANPNVTYSPDCSSCTCGCLNGQKCNCSTGKCQCNSPFYGSKCEFCQDPKLCSNNTCIQCTNTTTTTMTTTTYTFIFTADTMTVSDASYSTETFQSSLSDIVSETTLISSSSPYKISQSTITSVYLKSTSEFWTSESVTTIFSSSTLILIGFFGFALTFGAAIGGWMLYRQRTRSTIRINNLHRKSSNLRSTSNVLLISSINDIHKAVTHSQTHNDTTNNIATLTLGNAMGTVISVPGYLILQFGIDIKRPSDNHHFAKGGQSSIYMTSFVNHALISKYGTSEVVLKKTLKTLNGNSDKFELALISNLQKCNNIIKLYGYIDDEFNTWMAIKKYNMSLKEMMDNYGRRLQVGVMAKIARDICCAIDFIHTVNVIHNDVKPHNILIEMNGASFNCVLCDFGAARLVGDTAPVAGLCVPNIDAFTIRYSPPEVLSRLAYVKKADVKLGEIDKAIDIYALSITLFELITGENFMKGLKGPDLMANVLTGERVKFEVDLNLPGISWTITKGWSQMPFERPKIKEIDAQIMSDLSDLEAKVRLGKLSSDIFQIK